MHPAAGDQPFVSDQDCWRIAQAIRAAEQRTSGELVAMIAHGQSRAHGALLWAALGALLVPAPILSLRPEIAAGLLYLIQGVVFLGLALLLEFTAWQRLLPAGLRRWRASRLARRQFFERGLHLTPGRIGVLLFVSVPDQQVEIIADAGIDQVVPPGTWDAAIAAFVAEVRAGRVVEGFLATIERIGAELAGHFPRAADDVDELPNRLIEI